MTKKMLSLYASFVADEAAAIHELHAFVGGDSERELDETVKSLALLDRFVANLTGDPEWYRSALFMDGPSDPKKWLAVRVAYYLGRCLRNHYRCEWSVSENVDSPIYKTPVMVVSGIELSPLQISLALLDGDVAGGLEGFVNDLESGIQRNQTPE